MRIRILRLAQLAALAGLGLLGSGAGIARADESRESRDTREVRETREAREQREARERRDSVREQERERERSGSNRGNESRSGSGSGSDDDDDNDEDRDGNRSGSRDQRGTRGSGRVEVERDARGGDRQRGEALLVGSDAHVSAVRGAGYTVLAERRLESLRRTMVRVRVRDGQSVEQLLESLRQIAPGASVAPNHIYNPSQTSSAPIAHSSALITPGSAAAKPRAKVTADIGIIDTGADPDNLRLRPALLAHRGFATGGYQSRPHGTAVAQLASGQGATLAVADVFGVDARNHLVAPAEAIAAALDWMLSQHIRVVNISIEGPYNAVLELVVQDVISHGVAVVAAAGNGGPSAGPAYPAAYAGVVAVTALDERGRIYRRAARGDYLQFAARGSYGVDQQLVETRVALAGTSFASPVVAAEIAQRWHKRPETSREAILASMRADATDMGAPGHDPVYGWGRTAN